jgi:hypothetical protein
MHGATEQDFKNGDAVFYVKDGQSRRYNLGRSLPVAGTVRKQIQLSDGKTIPVGTPISIVQAEVTEHDVLLGFRYGSEQGICTLSKIALTE